MPGWLTARQPHIIWYHWFSLVCMHQWPPECSSVFPTQINQVEIMFHNFIHLKLEFWPSFVSPFTKATRLEIKDAFTYNGALCAMGRPETWPMALHFMRCMQRQGLQVTLITSGAWPEKHKPWKHMETVSGMCLDTKIQKNKYDADDRGTKILYLIVEYDGQLWAMDTLWPVSQPVFLVYSFHCGGCVDKARVFCFKVGILTTQGLPFWVPSR